MSFTEHVPGGFDPQITHTKKMGNRYQICSQSRHGREIGVTWESGKTKDHKTLGC